MALIMPHKDPHIALADMLERLQELADACICTSHEANEPGWAGQCTAMWAIANGLEKAARAKGKT